MVNGRRICGSASKTKSDALRSLRKKIEEAALPYQEPRPTLAEYVARTLEGPYAERVINGDMAETTLQTYTSAHLRHIEGTEFGDIPLDLLEPFQIEEWLTNLKSLPRKTKPPKPISAATKRRYAVMLSGILERARKVDKWIITNPVRDAEKPTPEVPEFRILTKEEVSSLLKLASETKASETPRKMLLIVMLGLHGLGPSEICGLRFEDFDGEGIDVKRQAKRGKLKHQLKTHNRKGWVAIHDDLKKLLENQPNGYVVGTSRATPLAEGNLRRMFHSMVKGTAFAGLLPYDLRHTFAMRLLEEGNDIRTVAELMRNTPEVVLNRYVRSRKDLKTKAVKDLF